MSATMLAAGTTAARLPYRAGEFYSSASYSSYSTGWTLDTMYLVPWYIGPAQAWDRIGIHAVVGVASALVRLGIYADDAGVPGNLIGDYGTVDCSSVGDKLAVISPSLSRGGWVWVATAMQGALAYVYCHLFNWDSLGSMYTAYQAASRRVTGVSGALPASAAGALMGFDLAPRAALRAA